MGISEKSDEEVMLIAEELAIICQAQNPNAPTRSEYYDVLRRLWSGEEVEYDPRFGPLVW